MIPLTRAERALVDEHRGVARAVVATYCRRHPEAAHLRSDLIQEATVGLMRAAQRFDPSVGVPFVTFAWRRVVAAVTREAIRMLNPAKCGMSRPVRIQVMEMPAELAGPADADPTARRDAEAVLRRLGLWSSVIGHGRPTTSLDMELFVRVRVLGENVSSLAIERGISKQRIHQLADRARPNFERIAAELRREVA